MQNALLASNIRKDQNENVFIRYLSLIQCIIERTKSTNCKSNNGSVNISRKTPIRTKSDFITNTFRHSKQKYPTTPKLTKKNLFPANFSNILFTFSIGIGKITCIFSPVLRHSSF